MRWKFSMKHAASTSFPLTIDVPCVSCLWTRVYALVRSIRPRCDMTRGDLPTFLACEYIEAPIAEGRGREPMILIFGWPRKFIFPDVPVYHAQNVSISGPQYGQIHVRLGGIFPGVTPTNKPTVWACTDIRQVLSERMFVD